MKKILLILLFSAISLFPQGKFWEIATIFGDDVVYVDNRVKNSGSHNTTDFLDANTDGKSDGFTIGAATYSIVTDGSRWQRIERVGGANNFVGITAATPMDGLGGNISVNGRTYNVKIRVRGNGTALQFAGGNSGYQSMGTISTVTEWTSTYTVTATDNTLVIRFNNVSDTSKYFEIDYIEIWE